MKPQTIAEQLLFSTVRIEADKPEGVEAGTAFIFAFTEENTQYLFLVTNKHVIKNSTIGRFFFTLGDGDTPKIGERFDVQIEAFSTRWYGHPAPDVDVTIMPIVPVLKAIEQQGHKAYFRSIPHDLIPTDEQIAELDVLEELVFVGYPSGIFDSKNLMPILRRGTTATPPQLEYEGRPVFLIDASVFPGSSGSPVFVYNHGSYATRKGVTMGSRVLLLGIIAEVVVRKEMGKLEIVHIPATQIPIVTTQQMIDLGIVYKSKTIMETVRLALDKWKKDKQAAG